MIETIDAFHFLRPLWLLFLPLVAGLWFLVRPHKARQNAPDAEIAPHLAKALHVGNSDVRRFYPIDSVALCLGLLAMATAGPTWSRIANPLVAETAPLVVAIKVTKSMETTDLAPSRLERARFKVLDLVEQRAGARTALIAYAGTAHHVSPLTEDPNILRPLLESLSSEVMPVAGDDPGAALRLASDVLETSQTPGVILFVLDDLNPAGIDAIEAMTGPDAPPIMMLVTLPGGQIPAQIGSLDGVQVVSLSADDSDINRIKRILRKAHNAALLADDRLQWNDRGWWLMWPAAVLALLWFRRGWTMRWGAVAFLMIALQSPTESRAEGWRDWFLTPDQQGRLAYENKDYAKAATLFTDPEWRGYAQLRAGQYADAAATFAGFGHCRSRLWRRIGAYQKQGIPSRGPSF